MKRKLLYVSKSIFLMLLLFAALPAFSAKIYFKNTLGWQKVYVYTYSSAYWSDTNGSGSKTENGCNGNATPMNPVETGSNIYWCEANQINQWVSFTNKEQNNYGNFYNESDQDKISVCYRSDYNESAPLFTPNTTKTGTLNQNTVDYYNNGTWSAYPTQTYVNVIHWGKDGMDWKDATITWNEAKTVGTATINFPQASTTYEFGLKTSSSNDWHSNSNATITFSDCENIVMNGTSGNTKITTTTAGEYNFTIKYNSENQLVVSVTYPSTTHKVNIVAGAGGTVSPEGMQQVGSAGLSVTATPSTGYTFTQWNVSGGAKVSDTKNLTTNVTATSDGSVTAVFTSSLTPSGGTYFLPGTWNNWSTSDETHKLTDGQTTLTLNPGTYSFKLYNGTWYGSTSSITGTSNINLSNTAGDISITIKEYGDYTFSVSDNSGALQLTVTYPTATKRFYLTGSVTSANNFSTMDDRFKIDPSKTTTITIDGSNMGQNGDNTSSFAIICDDDTDWWMRPSEGTKMTMGTSYEISSYNSNTNHSLYFNSQNKSDYKYIFTITISEGETSTATVKVQKILKNSSSVYFVSPELTNSERLEAFKMSSSRQRGGGDILQDRLSFNLQDFVLDAKHANKASITYWFEDKSGNKYYPATADYEFHDKSTTNDYAGKGTTYATVTATSSTDTPSAKFKLTRGKAKSYTWLLDTSSNKVEYIGNPSYFGNDNEAGAYYLVGNFADADAAVNIKPEKQESRKLMNKYWFKDGKAYTKETADADSIVYRVTVPMPAKGWSQLYLAVFSIDDVKSWDGSESGITASWDKAIRPEEQWQYDGGGLDGTALHGGLFAKGTKRADQAINPIVSDEYSSYTFSMNVTTSTYKLVFNSNKLYLMGPAVNDNDQTGWNSDGDNTYEMTYVQEEQCYKYLDASGFEKPMQLHEGKKFAFVYNKDFTNVFYDEDDVVPVDLSGTTDSNKEINAYGKASTDKGNYDTQYVNFIKSATSDKSAYDSDNVNACTFNLPSGKYTLRLYIRTDPNNPEKTEIYYLIKDRKYPFYWPDADASKMEGYTTFRSFCDYHAVIIPGGIDVFTVDTPNKTNKTVKLTSYTLEDNRVLPANTPVLLAKKDVGTRTLTSYVTMEYYSVPNYTATSATTNLLHGQVSRNHIPVSNDNGTLNFLFGYKKLQGDEKVTVGFFTPGAGNCSINTAYLTLSSDFWDEAAQQNTKGFRLVFDDNNETTSVDEIQTVSDNAPAVYYNMQGVRVLNPGKGLYIRNGKKYIIR